jgi:hypothetical protein
MATATTETYLMTQDVDALKNSELLFQNEAQSSSLQTWHVIIPPLMLILSTVSLIVCASNGCMSSSRSEARIKGCDTLCPEAQKIVSIVGLVVGALGCGLVSLLCCKQKEPEEIRD